MNESIEYLHEVFDAFGPIRVRRMFGAYAWGDTAFQAALRAQSAKNKSKNQPTRNIK